MVKKKSVSKKAGTVPKKNNTGPVVRNFILFLILTIISVILYTLSSSSIFEQFFGLLSIVLGFLAFAFLIIIVVFSIIRAGK